MSTDSSAPETGPADITEVTAPFPDEAYSSGTKTRLATLDVPGAGFGEMANLLAWAGRVQGTDTPGAFTSAKTIVITAATGGGMGAGGDDRAHRLAQLRDGSAPVARLAEAAGTPLEIVEVEASAPAEDGDTMSEEECLAALQRGADLADAAVDSGVDLIVLGALGEGLRTASIALTAHATNAEAIAWLPRVHGAPGEYDDVAWMARAAAVRDAMTNARPQARRAPVMLRALGGPAIAVATGLIVQAAVRRTPVLYDGPVAAAAAIMARDITLGAPKWCYAPDHGPHATVAKVNDLIGYLPVFDLKMDLAEGATALTLLPIMNTALTMSAGLPARVSAPKVDTDAT
ncbi:nicotinate-nucleotide--dimethylbenzimidazole phosphoribosyltransferase [Actinorhabdospora filicis]|uniref:nicotinate-nucleotide--dimethylbenzimidazole phosphoribosyltransferase n=1 Tax=Actinorhabdospora filicis TaxID=1785913 RepID=UPI002555B182|nr:nicotinate-nucleotide--dimethylbenzimidazole phosphoribosyltransferase [Actinorhabdospora filicis]